MATRFPGQCTGKFRQQCWPVARRASGHGGQCRSCVLVHGIVAELAAIVEMLDLGREEGALGVKELQRTAQLRLSELYHEVQRAGKD